MARSAWLQLREAWATTQVAPSQKGGAWEPLGQAALSQGWRHGGRGGGRGDKLRPWGWTGLLGPGQT